MGVPPSRMWLSVSLLAVQLGVGPADAQSRLGARTPDYRWTGPATVGAGPRLTTERRRTADGTLVGLGEPTARKYPATYYFEGAVIGASVVGATAAFLFYELACHYSDTGSACAAGPIAEAGVGAVLFGGTVGALIGGAFPAPRARPLRGHGARAALLGAAAGALWGFGVFAHFCLNGCQSGEVGLGVSTTAVGALAGLLVGR
jgi:hypothetical protein